MRLIIILLFKVLCLNITYSQEVITGKIVDENNDPLVGINIFFEEDKLIGTTSDINGNYEILELPAGAYNFKCSYISIFSL